MSNPYSGPCRHAPARPALLPARYVRPTWSGVSAALTANPPACPTEHARLVALVDRQLRLCGGAL